MIPILSGNVATALGGAYEVANSCRFNSADSAYMSRTPSSASNQKTWTFSCWVKKCNNGSTQTLITNRTDTNNRGYINWYNDGLYIVAVVGGTDVLLATTTEKYRDNSAWYHVCVVQDTTESTGSDRVKCFVNNVRQTLTFSATPSEDADLCINDDGVHRIGTENAGGASDLDGYLAEVCLIDGSALTPSSFGEYDEDSPTIWKPKDVSGLTFGTNGFYLDFEDSSALGNDVSGNNNDWTVTNLAATDQATDTPTNNFATLNPLKLHSGFSLSEGNTKFSTASGSDKGNVNSTILVNKGKWYAECKIVGGNQKEGIGAIGEDELPAKHFGDGTQNILFNTDVPAIFINSSQTNVTGVTPANNDIVGMALDLDNGRAYFHVNGTYINSGDVAGGSGYYSFTVGSTYWGIGSADGSTLTGSAEMNYGNPPFSISSGNADANGYGNFEYAVPSGYLALCTKNLGSDGG